MSSRKRAERLPGSGGARKGAGRPRTLAQGCSTRSVHLTAAQWAYLEGEGKGNVSAALREVVEDHQRLRQSLLTGEIPGVTGNELSAGQ